MVFLFILLIVTSLVLLISIAKLNPFVSFLIVCILTGLLAGMDVMKIIQSIQKGIGDIMGSLLIILCMGAMLGKLIAESGAANKISSALIGIAGTKHVQWALVLTAFIIGIPLFYGVGFVILVPLVIAISIRFKLPAVYLGLPALAALSVTHGFLPPHPSPVALSQQFNANIGMTLFYGSIIAIPTIIIAGPLFSITLKKYTSKPLDMFVAEQMDEEILPGVFPSLMAAFLPVILIGLDTLIVMLKLENNPFTTIIHIIGEPSIALLLSLLIATYTLGIRQGKTINSIMTPLGEAIKEVSLILLVISGAGALKQILLDSGLSEQMIRPITSLSMHPLFFAWLVAAIIRVSTGSATVAGLTTAGIVAPMIATSNVNPCLMVLATGAGSLFFSHVNDPAFWMFKEYFNLTVKQTIKTWSTMETIVSVCGLAGVFILNQFI
jgi:Gnt-I system high-affinity gluconate transporter